MKVCPKCNTQYADDTLSFCLDDGTPLAVARQADMPTAVFAETELVTSARSNDVAPDPRFMDSQVTRVGSFEPPVPRKSGPPVLVIALIALGLLLAATVIAFAAYVFYANRPVATNTATNNTNTPSLNNANAKPTATTTLTPGPSPSATTLASNVSTPTINPTPPTIDELAIKSEVSKQVYGWKSALESRDLGSYMSNYAPSLDYYTKRNVSVGTVRADKARAISMYSSMSVDVSNMSVSTSADGQTATAVFDKAWTFSGNGTNSGKVQSQLIFKRVGGRWLITSERDLKVYSNR